MKFLHIVWKNLLRRKIRTTFTLLSIFVAFVLFGYLMAVRSAFNMGVDLAGADRLMVLNKISIIMPVPGNYADKVRAIEGVKDVTHANWFGGYYQETKNQFPNMAVEPESWLRMYPEFKIPAEQVKGWLADRQAAIVGRDTAARYGWKIGDRIPIRATIWYPKQGDTWYFNLAGIYDGEKAIDKTNFLFRYDYLDENRRGAYGQVGWYIIRIADPTRAAEIATTLDAQFANSPAETKTSTEKAFLQGFVNQVGNVRAMMVAILVAVLFTLFFLVTANTMAQSVRERTSELAVLKTLGFSNGLVVSLVLAECLALAIVGGGLGLALTWMLVSRGSFNNPFLPVFVLTGRDVAIGILLCCGLGALAGALPAMSAMRLQITDALRRA